MTGRQTFWCAVIAKAISLKQSSFLLTIIFSLFNKNLIAFFLLTENLEVSDKFISDSSAKGEG